MFNLLIEIDKDPSTQFHALVDRTGETVDNEVLTTSILPFFLVYESFVRNVGKFVEVMTGVPNPGILDYTPKLYFLFKDLQQFGATKWEQFVPLYRRIQELNDTVESQKQMITALAYRHLIEHLPD